MFNIGRVKQGKLLLAWLFIAGTASLAPADELLFGYDADVHPSASLVSRP